MKNVLTINLEGINRASVRNTPGGPMEEVINVGKRTSGIHQAIGKKTVQALYNVNLELFTIYSFPALNNNQYLIGSLQETGEVYLLTPDASTVILTIDDPGTEEFRHISFLGNIITVHTDLKSYQVKYDPTDTSYQVLPEIPVPRLYLMYDVTRVESVTLDAQSTFDEAVADYLEKDAQMRKAGYLEGHTLYIGAWRLYDGSYIKPTKVLECWSGGGNAYIDTSATYQFTGVIYNKLAGKTYLTDDQLTDLTKWVDIIASFDIFMSYPESNYNVDIAEDLYDVGVNQLIPPRNETGLRHIDTKTISYYKVHEIPIESITQTRGAIVVNEYQFKVEAGNLNILTTKESLPVDQSSHHNISAGNSFLYNKRDHYADIHNRLYLGHNPSLYSKDSNQLIPLIYGYAGYTLQAYTTAEWSITSVVRLRTNEGEKVVYNTWTQQDELVDVYEKGGDPDLIFIDQILSYPDIRAYYMDIYLYQASTGKYYLVNGYDLTPNEFHNLSTYLSFTDLGSPYTYDIYPIVVDLSAPGTEKTPTEFAAATSGVLDRSYDDRNRIQLTGMDNPFYFPADNSYRAGEKNRAILKLMAMGEAISEGQFGQFPVYVFTESGIYTMEVGSGDVVYSAIRPLNSDVLSNVYSVVNVGKGVVYATSKGLFLISGSSRVEISQKVEGRLDNPIKNFSDYEGFLNTDVFIELLDYISARTFNETLQGGRIGFDRKNNEIIVSYYDLDPHLSSASGSASWSGSASVDDATRDGYSYIFNFDSGEWTKVSQQFNQFIDSYPDFLAIVGNSLYNLTEESTQDRHIILQSRPITLGTHDFKKILKLNVYGHFVPTIDTFPSVYVYGSQDGVKWALAQGQQVTYAQTHSTITVQRTIGWCKYYIILVVAQVSLSSNVEGIQLEFDTRYRGKLR